MVLYDDIWVHIFGVSDGDWMMQWVCERVSKVCVSVWVNSVECVRWCVECERLWLESCVRGCVKVCVQKINKPSI